VTGVQTCALPIWSVNNFITNNNAIQTFTFEGEADAILTISMAQRDDSLDTYLRLLAPNGRPIAFNDDSNGGFDATIDNIQLPEDGTYSIIATRFRRIFGLSTGAFELSVEASSGEPAFAQTITPIEYGDTLNGELTDDQFEQAYTFRADAGDVIQIELIALDEFDPILYLEDPQGREMMRNDDDVFASNIRNPTLYDVIIPADGWYTVFATTFENYGAFEISLSKMEEINDPALWPVYMPLNPYQSGGILPNGNRITYYSIGEWVIEQEEIPAWTLLNFVTQPLPEGKEIDRVVLDLTACRITTDAVFPTFEEIKIYVLPGDVMIASDEPITYTRDLPVLTTLDRCGEADITDLVSDVYATDADNLRLQLAFGSFDAINANDELDAAIFNNPTIKIYMRDS